MLTQKVSYKRHRFPSQIIAHVVWLYVRFDLSLREVEELMLERGVDVSYETNRRWIVKFGPLIAHLLRRRQPRPGDVWRLDEVGVKIVGRSHWLWRAVEQYDVVLEEILQSRRDKRAENNHLPFRKRERGMQGFRSPGGLQRFASIQPAAALPSPSARSIRGVEIRSIGGLINEQHANTNSAS